VTISSSGDISADGDGTIDGGLDVAGGYGDSGVTISSSGNIEMDGDLTIEGVINGNSSGDLTIGQGSGGADVTIVRGTRGGSLTTQGGLTVNTSITNDPINTTTAYNTIRRNSSSGSFVEYTSSRDAKRDIEDMAAEYAKIIYQLRPVWFRSTCEIDRKDWGFWGLIADEVAELDPRLVALEPQKDGTMKPIGVAYDLLTVHIIKELQNIAPRLEALEARAQ
jgi:hypothetical protein